MTLCAAWIAGEDLILASDSKLMGDNDQTFSEGAPKVFQVRLRVKGTSSAKQAHSPEPILYDSYCGICFSGSYLSGSSIADSIGAVLSNLQGARQVSDFSMSNISEIAFQVYTQVSEQQMQLHNAAGLSKALFSGYCPATGELMLYKFDVKIDDQVKFFKEQIQLSETPFFIGDSDAIDRAKILERKLGGDYNMFHLLRDVINDAEIISVGGAIQAGSFKLMEFQLYGIMHYELDEDDFGFKHIKQDMRFRSFSLDIDSSQFRKGNMNILIPLFNPFEAERNDLFKKVSVHNENHIIIPKRD